MDALEAIRTRRSTRAYKPEPVEPEKLEKILEAGRHAPSGSNNQTCRFLVVRDAAVLRRIGALAREAFAKMELREDAYPALKHAVAQSRKGEYVFWYNAPVLIITANRIDYGNNMADCAAALENMMVAANALDLGSCWINQLRWLNEDPTLTAYLRELGMAEDERVYASVAVGYPATADGLPLREPLPRKGNPVVYIG